MPRLDLGDVALNWAESGTPNGPAVVLAHALGTDMSLWDRVLPLLPPGYRYIRYDLRGHGGSGVPPAPYAMGTLVRDAERLIEGLLLRDTVFVGVSIGGMIAQGLAVKRPDLLRGVVLANTAVKIGTPEVWAARIAAAQAGGLAALADATMVRWFSRTFRAGPDVEHWRDLLLATPLPGYIGCCQAIAGTDFYTPTAGLRLPTLVIAGADDGSTPPDLVRETADLIPGARFALIRRCGHLPPAEAPGDFTALLAEFLAALEQSCGCGHAHPHHHHHGH